MNSSTSPNSAADRSQDATSCAAQRMALARSRCSICSPVMGRAAPRVNPLAAKTAALSRQGEIGHLPVHGGRAEPGRPVRSEAGAEETCRAAAARRASERSSASSRTATIRCCLRPGNSSGTGKAACAVSSLMPHLARVRGRHLLRADVLHGVRGARPRHVPGAHGPHSDGLSEHGLVGDVRPGKREREPAGVRRDAAAGRNARRRHAVLGRRLSAGCLPGDAAAKRADPILNLKPPAGMTPQRQRATLDLLQKMNDLDTGEGDTEMAARISSYELAFRMQAHAPEAVTCRRNPKRRRRCTASIRSTRPSSARDVCSRAGWSSAACGSCRSTPAAVR